MMTGCRRKSIWIWAGLLAAATIAGSGWLVYDLYVPRADDIFVAIDDAMYYGGDPDAMRDIRRFIRRKPDVVNEHDYQRWTPLFYAVSYRFDGEDLVPVMDLLIEHGADVNFKATYGDESDLYGRMGLVHIAVARGDDIELLDYLLAHGTDPNATTDPVGVTAAHLSGIDALKRLIASGADVNASAIEPDTYYDSDEEDIVTGWTPLFAAIQDKSVEKVRLLPESRRRPERPVAFG